MAQNAGDLPMTAMTLLTFCLCPVCKQRRTRNLYRAGIELLVIASWCVDEGAAVTCMPGGARHEKWSGETVLAGHFEADLR